MSADGPESVPTSADPRSHRPTKRRALTPSSAQAASVDALFARPDQEIRIPNPDAKSTRPPPPEIVTNVQGSSAGAGSGEFHVYKASRRREYERLREMDEEVRREKDNEEFDKEKEERGKRDDERTRKNREKREKMKARKAKKGKGGNGGAGGGGGGGVKATAKDAANGNGMAAKIAPRKDAGGAGQEDGGEEAAREEPARESSASAKPSGLVIHDDD